MFGCQFYDNDKLTINVRIPAKGLDDFFPFFVDEVTPFKTRNMKRKQENPQTQTEFIPRDRIRYE